MLNSRFKNEDKNLKYVNIEDMLHISLVSIVKFLFMT